eukprot:3398727-Prymnesium_polylepis.1
MVSSGARGDQVTATSLFGPPALALALPASWPLWCTVQAAEGVLNILSAPCRPRPLMHEWEGSCFG